MVLDEMRPFLIQDGGNVAVSEIDGPVVRLELQVSCHRGGRGKGEEAQGGHAFQGAGGGVEGVRHPWKNGMEEEGGEDGGTGGGKVGKDVSRPSRDAVTNGETIHPTSPSPTFSLSSFLFGPSTSPFLSPIETEKKTDE